MNNKATRPDTESIELRSEELQDMLTRLPSWLTLWGATLFFIFIVLFIALSWFVKSPDKITGTFILTTENPPVKLPARNSGTIKKLLIKDQQKVKVGDIIAEIENPMGIESVSTLNGLLTSINQYLRGDKTLTISTQSTFTYGDVQNDYNTLIKNYLDHKELSTNPFYYERIKELESQIKWQTALTKIDERQLDIFQNQLKNAKAKFDVDKQLHNQKVYSDMEYIQLEDTWLNKLMDSENYKKSVVQGQMTIVDLKKQLHQVQFDYQEKEREYRQNIIQSLKNIENYVKQWQRTYTLLSPSDGVLFYLKPFTVNQYVKTEDELFAVVQDTGAYVVYATIPSIGAGKLKKGQRVRLKFDHYTYQQFGSVDGILTDVSVLPEPSRTEASGGSSSYRVTIQLSNGLVTDYKYRLKFKPNMSGSAEIITDNLRLAERMLYSIRGITDK